MNSLLVPGAMVRHPSQPDWGLGQVQSVVGERVTVNFEDRGKVLINAAVVELEVVGARTRRLIRREAASSLATVAKRAARPGRPDQAKEPAAARVRRALRRLAVRPARPGAADRRRRSGTSSLDLADLQRVSPDERQPEITLLDRAGVRVRALRRQLRRVPPARRRSRPGCPRRWSPSRTAASIRHRGSIPLGIGPGFTRNIPPAGWSRAAGRSTSSSSRLLTSGGTARLRGIQEALIALWLDARLQGRDL